MLDPFPFGMGVTALETLSMGIPIVTLPSKQVKCNILKNLLYATKLFI
jgi:predicted O-linked N-acetylglucosamine transferase (SPINDLY family)